MIKAIKEKAAKTTVGSWLYRKKRAWEKVEHVLGARGAVLHFALGVFRTAAWKWFGLMLDLPIYVKNHWCPAGVYLRPGSSDWRVFRQIFVEGEYEPMCEKVDEVGRVVDLGANVGYSAVYFLERYPRSVCVCVEPDSRNFHLLLKNIHRYGARVKCYHAAVWNEEGRVRLDDGGFVGKEWGVRVKSTETDCGEGVDAITMTQLLNTMEWDKVDILKVDIEGAEKELLQESCKEWMGKVRCLSVELHDSESEALFDARFKPTEYELFESGELAVAVRRGRRAVGEANAAEPRGGRGTQG